VVDAAVRRFVGFTNIASGLYRMAFDHRRALHTLGL